MALAAGNPSGEDPASCRLQMKKTPVLYPAGLRQTRANKEPANIGVGAPAAATNYTMKNASCAARLATIS